MSFRWNFLILAKRLTEKQKEEIIQSFKLGKTIEELSEIISAQN